jgi:hypothetical protein
MNSSGNITSSMVPSPQGVFSFNTTEDCPAALKSVYQLENIRGALITMPHKVKTVGLPPLLVIWSAITGSRRVPSPLAQNGRAKAMVEFRVWLPNGRENAPFELRMHPYG